MRLRRLIGASVGLVGAAVAGNKVVSRRAEPLGPPLERETGTFRWRGMDIAYTEGGDPEDPDLLLVHDVHLAGTSREFNRLFDRLAESYHVLAPDLPGFGRSDRPPLTYSSTLYQTFIEDFVEHTSEEPTAIASGLSAAYLAEAAAEVDFARLVLVCPTSETRGRISRGLSTFLRSPVLGEAGFNALSSRRALRRAAGAWAFDDATTLSNRDLDYLWQTAHQPGARFAPSSMVAGNLDVQTDLATRLSGLEVPTTLVWGRAATAPPLTTGRDLAERADAKLVVLDRAKAFPHFEQPGSFLDLLEDELEAIP